MLKICPKFNRVPVAYHLPVSETQASLDFQWYLLHIQSKNSTKKILWIHNIKCPVIFGLCFWLRQMPQSRQFSDFGVFSGKINNAWKNWPYTPIYVSIRMETQPIELTESDYYVRHSGRLWSKILIGLEGVNLGPIIYNVI